MSKKEHFLKPTNNYEAERAILGQFCLSDQKHAIVDILEPEHFSNPKYALIFESIKQLRQLNKKIDLLTIVHQCKKNDSLIAVGGATAISELTAHVVSDANLEVHCGIMIEEWMRQKMHEIGLKMSTFSHDETKDIIKLVDQAFAAMEKLQLRAVDIMRHLANNGDTSVVNAIQRELNEIEADMKAGIKPGVSYGFKDLDGAVTKMQGGDLIIIAARPGMGKTVLALTVAVFVAVTLDLPVDFYSLEMPNKRLVQRILSMTVGIPSNVIAERKLTAEQLQALKDAKSKFNNNLHLYDSSDNYNGINVNYVSNNLKARHAALVIIDYLQLMAGDKKNGKQSNRQEEVAQISRQLKNTATKFSIPIIALSQLTRTTETKTSENRPKLTDLRESGAIEQDADIVLLMYRAAYYGFKNDDPEETTEIIIGKSRHSGHSNKIVRLLFDTKNLCFKSFTDKQEELPFDDGSPEEEQPF